MHQSHRADFHLHSLCTTTAERTSFSIVAVVVVWMVFDTRRTTIGGKVDMKNIKKVKIKKIKIKKVKIKKVNQIKMKHNSE